MARECTHRKDNAMWPIIVSLISFLILYGMFVLVLALPLSVLLSASKGHSYSVRYIYATYVTVYWTIVTIAALLLVLLVIMGLEGLINYLIK